MLVTKFKKNENLTVQARNFHIHLPFVRNAINVKVYGQRKSIANSYAGQGRSVRFVKCILTIIVWQTFIIFFESDEGEVNF